MCELKIELERTSMFFMHNNYVYYNNYNMVLQYNFIYMVTKLNTQN